jgi:hypothetical protein
MTHFVQHHTELCCPTCKPHQMLSGALLMYYQSCETQSRPCPSPAFPLHYLFLLQFTHFPQMAAIPPSSPRSSRRASHRLKRLKLIADMVASDPDDLSTIPQVLTGAHNAHYQTSLDRHAAALLATPTVGFATDPTKPDVQWPETAHFYRMLRQPVHPQPLKLFASALQRRIAPKLPASRAGAEFAFAPKSSPYLVGNASFKPSLLFPLYVLLRQLCKKTCTLTILINSPLNVTS